ncbi:MAG: hypothetical protein IJ733_16845 [Lachnospiraceae bacterium]|nr:hypothetical protein [Lachnospiraceae bacterium]
MFKRSYKKLSSILLIFCMLSGMVSLTGCGFEAEEKTVTLNVYSMLANYSGMQTGWMADVLKEELNIKLNITPLGNNAFETKMQEGDMGDIVVWGNDSNLYTKAVEEKLLYDWDKDNLLKEEGSYIAEHMQSALRKNRELTSDITAGEENTLYGFGNSVATSKNDHEGYIYTWDIRWDLYKQLGYPRLETLDDLVVILKEMCKLAPKNDENEPTYAMTLWPDWDDAMVMYVKATATGYYGYDELGIGLYDPDTGTFHGALEENGPYLNMLKFYNTLNQEGILDPNSRTQSYEDANAKMAKGTAMCSIFNYAGQAFYNTSEHLEQGKAMLSKCPDESCPLGYGSSIEGRDRIWSIGANTKYPKRCMHLLNYLCTPEGRLTTEYGPKGLCWDYDSNHNTSLTKLGEMCMKNPDEKLENGYKGTFLDGKLKVGNETWDINATNPESNEETYNYLNWKSAWKNSVSDIEKDWQKRTGAINSTDYVDHRDHKITPASDYHTGEKSEDLKRTWQAVTKELKDSSWKAIYAVNDEEYYQIVNDMIKNCEGAGYADCVEWSEGEAAKRFDSEKTIGE